MPKEYVYVTIARALRQRETTVEKMLWKKLRNRQLLNCKFRRQVPVGTYIADFLCFEKKLIIELDGGIHALQEKYDAERESFLKEKGYTVLRFKNHSIKEDVHTIIRRIMDFLV